MSLAHVKLARQGIVFSIGFSGGACIDYLFVNLEMMSAIASPGITVLCLFSGRHPTVATHLPSVTYTGKVAQYISRRQQKNATGARQPYGSDDLDDYTISGGLNLLTHLHAERSFNFPAV